MVDWDVRLPHLTIKDQAGLLSVSRTSLYRPPTGPSELEVRVKHLIDEIHTEHPTKGARTIRKEINHRKLGFTVNRKRIQRYMREMGITVIYPGPNLSKRNRAQYVFPYLLRHLVPSRPNHVWGIDITYLRMQGRWMYLVAMIDWYSRMLVGYELSQTMEKAFVLKAVNDAVKAHGAPEILNSDQGSQFTCPDYVDALKGHGIAISMNGKGRATDNAITERFFRTIKWENIYIMQYDRPAALRTGISSYATYYNEHRGHQSLQDATPASVYYARMEDQQCA